MNRGKKQSPFIGRRVPLVDDGVPILYPRYRDVSDVLLDDAGGSKKRPAPEQPEQAATANGHAPPPAAAAAAAAAPEQPSKKKSKKEKQQQQHQEVSAEPAAPTDSNHVTTVTPAVIPADESAEQHALRLRREEKARKKREKQAKRAAELAAEAATASAVAAAAAAAGTGDSNAEHGKDAEQQQQQQQAADEKDQGNAEEAARIRGVLGFSAGAAGAAGSTAAAEAAAPAATVVKVPPPSSGFVFNFGGLSGLPTEARVAAETEAKLAAIQAVTAADKDGFVPRRVFVGGMPYSYSREQVAEYWGWCGEIESLDCMTFPDTGRFRGIAFITFASQAAADSALQYDGEQVEGQTLKVERCKAAAAAKHMKAAATVSGHQQRRQQQQQNADGSTEHTQPAAAAAGGSTPAAGPGKTAGYNVAYVGNIAFEAGPDDLKALFAECGVTKVRLHTDKASGKSKGYAHVHFADEAGLDRALALSGSQLHGRGIKVSYGQPKKH